MTYIDYDSLSKEEQIKAVSKDISVIQYIDNPTEAVQLAAVKKFGVAIRYIKNPNEKVKLAAVNNYGFAIEYIDNPSDKLQIIALENRWYKELYDMYIKNLPNKTQWFHREFNRLKLIKGPLK